VRTRNAVVVSLVGLLLAVLGAVPAAAAPVRPDPGPAASHEIVAPLVGGRVAPTEVDPAGYWTPEKLADAIPVDEVAAPAERDLGESAISHADPGTPGTASHPIAPSADSPAAASRAAAPVPSSAGKLFYTYDSKDYVCSASTVSSANLNLVITAAHCVYHTGDGWHTNFAFAPAYYNGDMPYGLWNWERARTFEAWMQNGDYAHDQAFITFAPRNGIELITWVGGNGFQYNYGTAQPSVRVWGWPAEAPYDGEVPYYCDNPSTDRSIFDNDAQVACAMTGGASGGPWFRSLINDNLGYVFAVTSRRTTEGSPRYLISTPNTNDTKVMFDLMT
jgi:V8-like Glu-specific endopeptidase